MELRRWNFHALYNEGGTVSDVALNASGLALRGIDGAGEVPETRNPKIRDLEPGKRNTNPGTRDSEPGT